MNQVQTNTSTEGETHRGIRYFGHCDTISRIAEEIFARLPEEAKWFLDESVLIVSKYARVNCFSVEASDEEVFRQRACQVGYTRGQLQVDYYHAPTQHFVVIDEGLTEEETRKSLANEVARVYVHNCGDPAVVRLLLQSWKLDDCIETIEHTPQADRIPSNDV